MDKMRLCIIGKREMIEKDIRNIGAAIYFIQVNYRLVTVSVAVID